MDCMVNNADVGGIKNRSMMSEFIESTVGYVIIIKSPGVFLICKYACA